MTASSGECLRLHLNKLPHTHAHSMTRVLVSSTHGAVLNRMCDRICFNVLLGLAASLPSPSKCRTMRLCSWTQIKHRISVARFICPATRACICTCTHGSHRFSWNYTRRCGDNGGFGLRLLFAYVCMCLVSIINACLCCGRLMPGTILGTNKCIRHKHKTECTYRYLFWFIYKINSISYATQMPKVSVFCRYPQFIIYAT